MSQNLTQPEEIDLALSSIPECEMQGGMPSQDEMQAGANPDFGIAGFAGVTNLARAARHEK